MRGSAAGSGQTSGKRVRAGDAVAGPGCVGEHTDSKTCQLRNSKFRPGARPCSDRGARSCNFGPRDLNGSALYDRNPDGCGSGPRAVAPGAAIRLGHQDRCQVRESFARETSQRTGQNQGAI